MADLSKLSDADLEAIAAGDMTKVSDAGLMALSGEQPAPEFGAPPQLGPDGQVMMQQQAAPAPAAPQPSMGEQFVQSVANIPQTLVGAAETAGTLATGATVGPVVALGATLKAIVSEMLQGRDIAEPNAQQRIRQAAERGMQAGTYQPQTQAGQQIAGAVGQALAPVGEAMLPLTPMMGGAPAALPSARAALPAAAAITQEVIPEVVVAAKRLPGVAKVTEAVGGPKQNMGAAVTPEVQQRLIAARSLDVPVTLTKGAATREAAQLAFEKEQIRNPEIGLPLLKRAEENNIQILQNLENFIDQTGAVTRDRTAAGRSVTTALLEGYDRAKTKVRVAYNKAFNSPGANEVVNTSRKILVDRDGVKQETTVFDFLNETPDVPSNQLAKTAGTYAVKLGIAELDDAGKLVPKPGATVKQMELWRREVGTAVGLEPNDKRLGAIIKNMIDDTVGDAGGPEFAAARKARFEQAQRFENRGVVARLVQKIANMDDPKVEASRVYKSAISNRSPDEIAFLKKILQSSGKNGRQAWRELQGQMTQEIYEAATGNVGMGSKDEPIVSAAKLHAIVTKLDRNGQLEAVLGKRRAQKIRDLNDVVRYVETVPKGTLINTSGTASALLQAIGALGGETAAAAAVLNFPAPVVTTLRLLYGQVKKQNLKAKIADALEGTNAAIKP
jgi:hypothetical protein